MSDAIDGEGESRDDGAMIGDDEEFSMPYSDTLPDMSLVGLVLYIEPAIVVYDIWLWYVRCCPSMLVGDSIVFR